MAEQAAHNRLVEGSNPSGPMLCLIGGGLSLTDRRRTKGKSRSIAARGQETGAIRESRW